MRVAMFTTLGITCSTAMTVYRWSTRCTGPSTSRSRERGQIPRSDQIVSGEARDVLTPREVAERSGFSYHAILRAIRRGDLQAFEPVAGHYRIEVAEYERWLRTPARRADREPSESRPRRRATATAPSGTGSLAALRAIEAKPG